MTEFCNDVMFFYQNTTYIFKIFFNTIKDCNMIILSSCIYTAIHINKFLLKYSSFIHKILYY